MAYRGKTPVIGNFVKLDSITTVNGQAAYTMQNGGVNFTSYDNVNQFLVSLNGVLQAPTDSFTVSGSTLTFASNLSTGDVIDFVLVLGNSLDIGTPSDNTISTAKLQANAVTSAKLGTDVTQGITMAENWRVTANITANATPISSNLEVVDTDGYGSLGTGMSESSGIFTFPSTGIYFINFVAAATPASGDTIILEIQTTTDNSTYATASRVAGTASDEHTLSNHFIFDVTDTSTHKMRFNATSISGSSFFRGDTNINFTSVVFIRLGDT